MGRWRWDGNQWVPAKPTSSKRPGLPGPGKPQLSSDGRWWWNGYQWVPARPVLSKQTRPPGPGPLAAIAAGLGIFAVVFIPASLLGAGSDLGYAIGVLSVILSLAVVGMICGVLALVFPGHGHDRSLRRRVAGGGVAASLIGASLVGLLFASLG